MKEGDKTSTAIVTERGWEQGEREGCFTDENRWVSFIYC